MTVFVRRVCWYWLLPVAAVLWEAVSRRVGAVYFPPPSIIMARLHELWFSGPSARLFLTDEAVTDLLPSLGRLFIGWALASLTGVVVGLTLGRSLTLAALVEPLLHFGRSIPPSALLPVFLLLFKIGTPMQLATIMYGVIWPVLINAIDGGKHVDRQYLETARAFKLGTLSRLARVILPAAAPKIFAGLRLSLSLALIMMVVSELYASTDGIGHRMLQARSAFDIPAMWAGIMLLGILGVLLNAAFVAVERSLLAWHASARADLV